MIFYRFYAVKGGTKPKMVISHAYFIFYNLFIVGTTIKF
jgi:hypothetical protein